MTLIKKLLATAALALGVSTAANAAFAPLYVTTLLPVSFVMYADQAPNTTLQSASLKLTFTDPTDFIEPAREEISVFLDGQFSGKVLNIGTGYYDYNFNVLPSMLANDHLLVTIALGCIPGLLGICIEEDVWLNNAVLSLNTVPTTPTNPGTPGTPGSPTDVPEPATLMSLAIGMLGLAAARRRKQRL